MNKLLAMIPRALVVAFLVGISLFTALPTSASTINVGCDVNELINAINTANANADADILELSAGCEYTLTNVDNTDTTLGPNGLPIITSDITINGNNATIERDSAAPNFRLIQINSGATLALNQVTLTGGATSNRTDASDTTDGGAIYNAGTCTLNHATLTENRTGNGGNGEGSATVSNSTFTENNTGAGGQTGSGGKGGDGGAIGNNADTILLINVTLSENGVGIGATNGTGGNLSNATGTINAHGTIFANPSSGQNCSGTLQDNTGNLRYPKSDASCVGIFGNPKLGPLQANGGATQTMALALDSPAINAAGVIVQDCPAADQRGIVRPQGKYCDSGAFELQAPTAPTLIKPANNAKLTKSIAKLKWSAAERVSHYQVVVRMDSAKGTKVVTKKLTARKFVTPVLESGHWYYWSIKACSKVGCTSSPWQRFRIKEAQP